MRMTCMAVVDIIDDDASCLNEWATAKPKSQLIEKTRLTLSEKGLLLIRLPRGSYGKQNRRCKISLLTRQTVI